jgi:hypothetical protein
VTACVSMCVRADTPTDLGDFPEFAERLERQLDADKVALIHDTRPRRIVLGRAVGEIAVRRTSTGSSRKRSPWSTKGTHAPVSTLQNSSVRYSTDGSQASNGSAPGFGRMLQVVLYTAAHAHRTRNQTTSRTVVTHCRATVSRRSDHSRGSRIESTGCTVLVDGRGGFCHGLSRACSQLARAYR